VNIVKFFFVYSLGKELVTAGVHLLIRFSPCFGYWLNVILLLVSGLTTFVAGFGANFEFDLRRIIALSTLNQLRLIFITIIKRLSMIRQ
jgi:NADH-ubiquinone oxidoreductase chain 5